MSRIISTKYRSEAVEIMDDFSLKGELLRDTLDKLALINKFLGGNNVTINGLKQLLKNVPKDKTITIVDLGCGGGDILREIARFGRKAGYKFQLIGIDANKDATVYAGNISEEYPEIEFKHMDIFSAEFEELHFNIVLATLFFHHFKDEELIGFLKKLLPKVTYGIIVNDLHRNKSAYKLYQLLCIGINNEMIKNDGLISILRGFKREDIQKISEEINANYQVKWKWAFRFQWIMTPKKN